MRLDRVGDIRSPMRRARFAGVGLAGFGAVGLGLAVVPACGGGGSTGENAVHLEGSAAYVAPLAGGGGPVGDNAVHLKGSAAHVTPNCGGGGATGDN